MPTFNKYVKINDCDLAFAIRQGTKPMQLLFDPKHDRLPFFWNMMCGGDFVGNQHHPTYSISHIPGRWLNALLNAEDVLGIEVDEKAIQTLQHWTYESVEKEGLGLPCCIDTNTFAKTNECDLHNLREVMHACYALVRYRQDEKALETAKTVIASINRYYDFENARFRREAFLEERGGKLVGFLEPDYTFPMALGRYIGPLVKLYKTCGLPEALDQAIRLKDVCFRYILDEQGSYDGKLFGYHTHSTTSMISSLAQLAEVTGDMSIMQRVRAFLNNGLNQIATDFGWCLEMYERDNMGGEANNTADIMEACLILGKCGYPEGYDRAEKILRAHLLPSQLLDTSFVPDCMDPENEQTYRLAKDTVGAFGFPCPWGHEYEPGSPVSFNWDIVGGAVGGMCEAWRSMVEEKGRILSVNMLFSYEDEHIAIKDPYLNQDVVSLMPKHDCDAIRMRVSPNFEVEKVEGCAAYSLYQNWLYLWKPKGDEMIRVHLKMEERVQTYRFRDLHTFQVRWHGQRITGMSSAGKRLCYFPELG